MKEIGGYMEFEQYRLPMLHDGAVGLNCGRNCLAYLIRAKNIKKIVLPYFCCESVRNTCMKYHVATKFYHIDKSFLPVDLSLESDEWLYLVNFYSQIRLEEIRKIVNIYKNVIVDYTQSYFSKPLEGVDSLYSCRKFFGVSDGAFLYTDQVLEEELEFDESYERIGFILGRYERTAQEFYKYSVENNQMFSEEPIKKMSKLTRNILHSIDYEWVKNRRTENYMYLFRHLNDINQLQLNEIEGAFSYPCMIENAPAVRKKMIKKGIYIPILWSNVLEDMEEDSWDYQLANNILSLPCDQRYGKEEMESICKILFDEIKKVNCR